jgi:riboflavin kinase/FMN adenylyltransferase
VNLLRDLDRLPERFQGGAVSIGNFDGVHRGHALLIERLVARAREVGGPAVVFTFDPHSARLLRPDKAPTPLCWTQRKAELLAELGADAVVAYPTDEALLLLEPGEFFQRIVRARLSARAMVEGSNFFFGRGRKGTIDVLRRLCAEARMPLEVVQPVEIDGQSVSSSRVRASVSAGRMDEARRLLTRPYRIRGVAVAGSRRGSGLGFPTANLAEIDTLLPAEGIYAGRGWLETTPYPAAISVGPNPTFDEGALKVEVYLLDYDGGPLYGRTLDVDFLSRLRDIRQFESAEQLVVQMAEDVAQSRRIAQEA